MSLRRAAPWRPIIRRCPTRARPAVSRAGGDPTRAHVLCLGGTETFGRFVAEPYPSADLGIASAAARDQHGRRRRRARRRAERPAIARRRRATAIVLQIPEAQNLSNRLYTVHPRRNDRFIKRLHHPAHHLPRRGFHRVSLHRHMLDHLGRLSADRFAIVRAELCTWPGWRGCSADPVRGHVPGAPALARLPAARDAGKPGRPCPRPQAKTCRFSWTPDLLEAAVQQAASLSVVAGPMTGARPRRAHAPQELRAARALPGPDAS
jgi:hypothetical protein